MQSVLPVFPILVCAVVVAIGPRPTSAADAPPTPLITKAVTDAPAAEPAEANPPPPPPSLPPRPRPKYLTPEESRRLIQVPEGYRVELVLSDPQIKEPVLTVFDGNGRM